MELTFLPVNMVKEKGDNSGLVLPLCCKNSLFDFFFRCDFCYTFPLYIVAIHLLFFIFFRFDIYRKVPKDRSRGMNVLRVQALFSRNNNDKCEGPN